MPYVNGFLVALWITFATAEFKILHQPLFIMPGSLVYMGNGLVL
jgi:hypothetical protein